MRDIWKLVGLWALVALVGCLKPRTEIVVVVRTDLGRAPGVFESVVMRVARGARINQQQRPLVAASGGATLFTVGVLPEESANDLDTPVVIDVWKCSGRTACPRDTTDAQWQHAELSFSREQTVWLPVDLSAACLDARCSPESYCTTRGRCVAGNQAGRYALPDPPDATPDAGPSCSEQLAVDLLFVVDNSNSMSQNQQNLAENFGVFIDALTAPPTDPQTGRPLYQPVSSLHVGVISTDLGTPGSVVPSCANSDVGDNGFLNPIRNGLAMRTHQPWTTAPPGRRPARCTMDMNQYPNFLTFSASASPADFRDDFVCNAYLSTGGCGLEQQLESAYRALVTHDARDRMGNVSPNAGFVRDDAVLGIVFVTDEEDGSVRDTRHAEPGFPVQDATDVFNSASTAWASNADLNLRFYMYTPGSAQDPTWPLDRYLDPANPARGFTGLKPGRPELVVIGAIAGVPLEPPTTTNARGTRTIDWDVLLGRTPDGSDGYTAMSSEGPVSMRQRNMDPMCSTRVVPACRREGSSHNPMACDAQAQYFAWPSRRIAELVRRADERYGNGLLTSICRNSYGPFMQDFARRLGQRFCPQGR
jgi:hypothetical protein